MYRLRNRRTNASEEVTFAILSVPGLGTQPLHSRQLSFAIVKTGLTHVRSSKLPCGLCSDKRRALAASPAIAAACDGTSVYPSSLRLTYGQLTVDHSNQQATKKSFQQEKMSKAELWNFEFSKHVEDALEIRMMMYIRSTGAEENIFECYPFDRKCI